MDKFKQIFDLIKELTDEDFDAAMEIAETNIHVGDDINPEDYTYVDKALHSEIKAVGYFDYAAVQRLRELKDNRLALDDILNRLWYSKIPTESSSDNK